MVDRSSGKQSGRAGGLGVMPGVARTFPPVLLTHRMLKNVSVRPEGGGGGPGEYTIKKSCTFNGSDERLTRTWSASPTLAGNWSFSVWIKRAAVAGKEGFFGPRIVSSKNGSLKWAADNQLEFYNDNAAQTIDRISTNTGGTDYLHLLVTFEVGAAGNPMGIFFDGTEETYSYSLDQGGTDYAFGRASTVHDIGQTTHDAGYFEGNLAEIIFIDGLIISVGDVYAAGGKPVDPSGLTFGDDGFHLNFEDSSDMGKDVSGNGNDFTLTNIDSSNQSSTVP